MRCLVEGKMQILGANLEAEARGRRLVSGNQAGNVSIRG
jgi:hypothetical protein